MKVGTRVRINTLAPQGAAALDAPSYKYHNKTGCISSISMTSDRRYCVEIDGLGTLWFLEEELISLDKLPLWSAYEKWAKEQKLTQLTQLTDELNGLNKNAIEAEGLFTQQYNGEFVTSYDLAKSDGNSSVAMALEMNKLVSAGEVMKAIDMPKSEKPQTLFGKTADMVIVDEVADADMTDVQQYYSKLKQKVYESLEFVPPGFGRITALTVNGKRIDVNIKLDGLVAEKVAIEINVGGVTSVVEVLDTNKVNKNLDVKQFGALGNRII